MTIVFGSPEAKAILERDKELQKWADGVPGAPWARQGDEEEPKGDSNELAERLESLEFLIEEMESDLAALEDEAAVIREKLKTMARPDPEANFRALRKWNAWARGEPTP